MGTVFTNGRVSLTKCMVFGVCVLVVDCDNNQGWVPFKNLPAADQDTVRRALDHNPTCPDDISQVIYATQTTT